MEGLGGLGVWRFRVEDGGPGFRVYNRDILDLDTLPPALRASSNEVSVSGHVKMEGSIQNDFLQDMSHVLFKESNGFQLCPD